MLLRVELHFEQEKTPLSLRLKVLAAVFALSSSFSASAAPRTYIAPAAERDSARAIADAYRDLSSKIPLELYDVDGLAESLDYDVAAAANFVREKIAYDPYLGVMRGPQGAISASAGSSWDQAVLLAALINAMAGEAMIVKGTLEKKDAERLLQVSFSDRAPLSPGLVVDDVTEALKPFVPKTRLDEIIAEARELEKDADKNALAADRDVSDLAKKLSASLKTAGVSIALSDADLTDRLVDQIAEEYVWVRYRNTPNDPWVDVHPAFQNAVTPKVEPESFIAGTVPDDRLHKIEIRLEIERKTGDKYERISIMSPYRRPAANLALTQVSIGIAPDTVRSDGEASFFTPVMNQAPAERAQAFTLQGLTASAEDLAAGPAIFATVGSKYAGALGGLNATDGKTDTAPRLSGVILTVIHISPGGASTSVERRLTDFRLETPESPSHLVSFQGILDVNVGRENGARAMKDVMESTADLMRTIPYFKAVIEGRMTPEEALAHPAFSAENSKPVWSEMLAAGNAFNPDVAPAKELVRFGPMVSMQRTQTVAGAIGIVRKTMDILVDETLSLTFANGAVSVSPSGNLEQGIRATLAEHELGAGSNETDWKLLKAGPVLENAQSVATWSNQSIAPLALRDRLNADSESGTVLVMLDGVDEPLWWRVNTQTGQTLGMGLNGGQATIEEAIMKRISLGIALGGWVMSAQSCVDTYKGNTTMQNCCVLGNTMVAIGTAGAMGPVSGFFKPVGRGLEAAIGYIVTQLTLEIVSAPLGSIAGRPIEQVCKKVTQ
ncbi:hypothetical protein [Hyphomonas sp.]|uniref:hypothetical protein n=1 Tax=Hyphomonas sp. TaxID=87 RepID=UPI00356A0463